MLATRRRRVEASDLPKYTAPRRRPDTTRRPRLNRQLQDTLDRDVTVFCAPAGYGKSTLAVDWLDESGMRYAWLSLDRQDRDARVFMRNIAGAIATAFPGSLEEFSRHLDAAATSSEASVFVGPLAAAVERDIDDLFVLVLDDVHVLAGSAAVDVLDLLLVGVPLNARLLLLTRAWDVLPGLARAVSDRRAFALLKEDLAFDASEAARLLRRSGVRDAEVRRRITEQADGWAAALAVLGEHHDVQAPERGAAKSAFVLADFLDHEVLARLAPDERALLEACAVLESFDLALVRDLTRTDDAPGALHALELRTQLIARIGASGWYRVHGLLGQHLLARLDRDEPARLLELRRAARAVCTARGMPRRALELALDCEDWDEAVAGITALREELYQQGEWSNLLAWLDRLPTRALEASPGLRLARARLAMKFAKASEGLARLDAMGFGAASNEDGVRWHTYRSVALRHLGRIQESLQAASAARELVDGLGIRSSPLEAELDLEEAISLVMAGRCGDAVRYATRAAARLRGLGDDHRAAEACEALAVAQAQLGDLVAASVSLAESTKLWRTLGDPRHQLLAEINIGEIERARGRFGDAKRRFEEVLARARELGLPRVCGYALENLGAVEHDVGNLAAAEAHRRGALRLSEQLEDAWLSGSTRLGLALLRRDSGDLETARAQIEAGLVEAGSTGMSSLELRWRGALGSVLLEMGKVDRATSELETALAAAASGGDLQQEAVNSLRLAAARLAGNDPDRAMAHLSRLCAVLDRVGGDAFILFEARRHRPTIEFGAARGVGGAHLDLLSSRVATTPPDGDVRRPSSAAASARAISLGDAVVEIGGSTVPESAWRSERAKEMFFLLLWMNRPLRKEEIVVAIWPEIAPGRVNSTFHSTLFRLRHVVGKDAVVRTADGQYRIGEGVEVDFDARRLADGLTDLLRRHPPGHELAIERLLALSRGSFLPACESDWASDARAELKAIVGAAFVELADCASARKDWRRALEYSLEAVECDPTNELAAAIQIQAAFVGGSRAAAWRAFRQYVRAVRDEYGAEPSPDVRRLYERLIVPPSEDRAGKEKPRLR